MTSVTMKAVDQLHLSGLKADSLQPDEQFTVPSSLADELEKRGLAVRVDEPEEKAAPEPENKVEAAPPNKAASPRKAK